MKDQIKVHRVGSEIEVQVRDQCLLIWSDDAARQVAKELVSLLGPAKPAVIPDGTKVKIVKTIPEDWDSSWWPSGRTGVVRRSFEESVGKVGYMVDLDGESDGDLYFGPDYYLEEDLEIVGPS